MKVGSQRYIEVIGDRVLLIPDKGEERTEVGLYLPRPPAEKTTVMGGTVAEIGPGLPLPDPHTVEDEPWRTSGPDRRRIPMQVRIGDYVVFLRKSAVEIRIDSRDFMVVPQSAILVLVRKREGISGVAQE